MGDGLVQRDIHQRLDVGDDRVDILGQPAGRNHAASDHVDEDEFIAGRVTIRQGLDANARGHLGLKCGDDFVILLLDSDHAFTRADQVHGHLHAAQEGLGVVMKQLLVLVQQGLAFSRVGNDHRNRGFELYRGGKTAAARAHDPVFLQAIEGGGLQSTPSRPDSRDARFCRHFWVLPQNLSKYCRNMRLTLPNTVSYHSSSIKISQNEMFDSKYR